MYPTVGAPSKTCNHGCNRGCDKKPVQPRLPDANWVRMVQPRLPMNGDAQMSAFLASFGVLTVMFLTVALLERVPRLQHAASPLRRPWFETDLLWYLVAALAAGMSTFVLRPVLVRLAIPG